MRYIRELIRFILLFFKKKHRQEHKITVVFSMGISYTPSHATQVVFHVGEPQLKGASNG